MSFAVAQTFTINPSAVKNASQVGITEVQLWFRAKPSIDGNKSGIFAPGVQIALVPCQFGVPLLGQSGVSTNLNWVRQEWGAISVSADATQSTRFRWLAPQPVVVGQTYAIVVQFDADEDFLLWYNKTGDLLVGTSTSSTGPSGANFNGSLYTYIGSTGDLIGAGVGYSNSVLVDTNTIIPSTSQQVQSQVQLTQKDLLTAWSPVPATSMMFTVTVARYMHSGIPIYSNSALTNDSSISIWGHAPNNISVVSNNVLRITSQTTKNEYINYDKTVSVDSPTKFGDVIYQHQPYYTGGKSTPLTVAIANGDQRIFANSTFTVANGATFNWNMLYSPSNEDNQWIVVTSLNHDGAGAHRVNVRALQGADIANNMAVVTVPFDFDNSAAQFYLAPIGRVASMLQKYGAGGPGSPNAKSSNILVLSGSTVNSTCRFVNNGISAITLSANGSGYSNSDVVNITGFENVGAEVSGGYKATANIVTNGSGAITNVVLTNTGCGFVNTSQTSVAFSNSSGGASGGSGATLTLTYGNDLYNESTGQNTHFSNVSVINLDAAQLVPLLHIDQPSGAALGITFETLYHSETTSNTFSGVRYYVNDNPLITDFTVKNGALHNFPANLSPSIVSRSNQYAIRYANGAIANDSVIGTRNSNTVVYFIDVTANNDFVSPTFSDDYFTSQFAKYIINNDYTNEHTAYGNAWAKTLEKTVSLANGMSAEDMIVYVTGFRPPGTDFKVYARIYNSLDTDPYISKDYSLMTQTDGLGLYSNPSDETDEFEYTYTFPMYPNTDYTSTGTVTTGLNSNVVTGSGTNFSSNLAVGDIVKLYQPLFPNNYMLASVGSITNSTQITLTTQVANAGIVGTGLKIDRIKYPHQAYHDILNANVVTYFNSNSVPFSTYDTFQVKVVFLSNSSTIVPKIDDIRAVCASA